MPLDPQLVEILVMRERLGWKPYTEITPTEARAQMALLRPKGPPEPVHHVEDRTIPGPAGAIPVRIYRPEQSAGVVVYYHGGGWVIGDLESHDATCRAMANRSGCTYMAVDYRLAPEHPYPAAAADAYAALCWASEHAAALGSADGRVALAGDSAGGNLAAVAAQMACDRRGPALAGMALVYPVTDFNFETGSYRDLATGYGLTLDGMQWFWEQYVPDARRAIEPYASPLRAPDVSGLPRALVLTAEFDPLRDEGEAYAARLRAAGVPATCTRYVGANHGFFGAAAVVDLARHAQAQVAAFLREACTTP